MIKGRDLIKFDAYLESVVFEVGRWRGIEYPREQVEEMVKRAKGTVFSLKTDFDGELVGVVSNLRLVGDLVMGDISIFDRARLTQKEIVPRLTYAVTPINRRAEDVRVVDFGLVSESVNPRWRLIF